ncbi:MAG TPA: diacylglycerol kinase family protein [Streptosporangiaceae bacterium]
MRALLIVNPHATSTTRLRRDVIASALASAVDLEVVETRYRGHAASLAASAASDGRGLVLTFGGDGTVNEAVNGIMAAAGPSAGATARPVMAALPGGNANVFTRSLGLPADPVDAAGQILQAIGEDRHRSIGLGLAGRRYFAFNAGLGLDAEVVRAVEGRRAHGRAVTPALYLRMAGRQFFQVTDRRHPALAFEYDGGRTCRAFVCIVSNTAPWTYLGERPVQASPLAGFELGLDVLALCSLGTVRTLLTLRQMLSVRGQGPPSGRRLVSLHDRAALTVRSDRPIALQVDGEYVGEEERVTFRAVPDALRVIA